MVDHDRIKNTMDKMEYYLSNHNSICVGVQGGQDSNIIVHIIATYFRQYLDKIHFVFQNTGLEWKATLKHLDYMEQTYDIKIDRIRPDKGNGVVSVVRKYGIPIVSKEYCINVSAAQNGSVICIEKINGTYKQKNGKLSMFNFTKTRSNLARYIIDNNIKISSKCCDLSKKKPYKKYLKSVKADMTISGERKAEGGIRAAAHDNCFEEKNGTFHIDKYMPLFFWDDETKNWYKENEGIVYSDCYEVYGMKRTGCVSCPLAGAAGNELNILQKYEPNLYKACMNVFGESYYLMDKFNIRRHKILDEDDLNYLKNNNIRMDG